MSATREAIPARTLIRIFALALALRWAYVFGLYLAFGIEALQGPDSHAYLVLARDFADAVRAGSLSGWAWLGTDLALMPLFTWSIALHSAIADEAAAFGFTLIQGLFDAGTAALVACIAARFAGRFGAHAGYAAALTPTFIVLSGLVYTDTAFVFFATFGLHAALRWMEAPSWRWALALGAGFALAASIRVAGLPFLAAALPFMAIAALVRRQLGPRQLVHLAAAGMVAAAAVAPVLARNVAVYGAWSLTPQSGNHLAYWILPLVKEAADGTPREATKAANDARIRERYGPMPTANPFADSRRYREYAGEELAKLGIGAIARAWLFGAAINLAAPAVVHVPPVSKLPRTGFYDTPGADFRDKLGNFLFGSGNRLYAWLLLLGLAGVAAFRIVQLAGLVALMRRGGNLAGLMLLGGWCLYILLLNGPIASPKYRLPLEPALALLSGAGAATLLRRGRGRSGKPQA